MKKRIKDIVAGLVSTLNGKDVKAVLEGLTRNLKVNENRLLRINAAMLVGKHFKFDDWYSDDKKWVTYGKVLSATKRGFVIARTFRFDSDESTLVTENNYFITEKAKLPDSLIEITESEYVAAKSDFLIKVQKMI